MYVRTCVACRWTDDEVVENGKQNKEEVAVQHATVPNQSSRLGRREAKLRLLVHDAISLARSTAIK